MSHTAVARRVAQKELQLFFASPWAWLLLAAGAALSLYLCFRMSGFFERNTADLLALFQWLPPVLMLLCPLLTMGRWSRERRSGTLEQVLTLPAGISRFVLGKFRACLLLLGTMLLATAPLAVTVSLITELHWAPVATGYLAALLLGSAFLSIGLFVSACTTNTLVSLLVSVSLCALLYVPGTPSLSEWVDPGSNAWLAIIGAGNRFDQLARGLVDVRDLYYFLAVCALFLTLNIYALERLRWSEAHSRRHRYWRSVTALLVINLLLANLWLARLPGLRWDLTAERWYTLSAASTQVLQRLEAPLLIRCYCSTRGQAQLAPLLPSLWGLLQAYANASGGRIHLERLDPLTHPERAREAAEEYGLQSAPLPLADGPPSRPGETWFHLVLLYGEQYRTLPPAELIELRGDDFGRARAQLRKPEYTLTRAIRDLQQNQAASLRSHDIDPALQLAAPAAAPAAAASGGLRRSVALALPPTPDPNGTPSFDRLRERLSRDYRLQAEQLEDGQVSTEADLLAVVSPHRLDLRARYAIDQFLMRGGTVVLATAPYRAGTAEGGGPRRWPSGLERWLAHQGLRIASSLVVDAEPDAADRRAGRRTTSGHRFEVGTSGLNPAHPVTAGVTHVMMDWASPITAEQADQRRITVLLRSSAGARTTAVDTGGNGPAKRGDDTVRQGPGVRTLGLIAQGRFHSWFVDHPRPDPPPDPENPALPAAELAPLVDHSPLSARIILFSSNELVDDQALELDSATGGDPGALRLFMNAIDWSLQDSSLLQIRPRHPGPHGLPPLSARTQALLEYAHYALALGWPAVLWLGYRLLARLRLRNYRRSLQP